MKKKMFSQEKRDLVYIEKYEIQKITFNLNDIYGFSSMKAYDQIFSDATKQIKPTNDSVLFQIQSNFEMLEKVNRKDRDMFYLTLTNLFVSYLFGDEKTDSERRLTPLKTLEKVRMGNLVKTDLGNKKLNFPTFGVEFIDSNDRIMYEVMV